MVELSEPGLYTASTSSLVGPHSSYNLKSKMSGRARVVSEVAALEQLAFGAEAGVRGVLNDAGLMKADRERVIATPLPLGVCNLCHLQLHQHCCCEEVKVCEGDG